MQEFMFQLICSFLGLVTFTEEILNEKLHFLCSAELFSVGVSCTSVFMSLKKETDAEKVSLREKITNFFDIKF